MRRWATSPRPPPIAWQSSSCSPITSSTACWPVPTRCSCRRCTSRAGSRRCAPSTTARSRSPAEWGPHRQHRGRRHRLSVRRIRARGAGAGGGPGGGRLRRPHCVAQAGAGGDGAAVRLGSLRRTVPRAVSSGARAAVMDFVLALHSHLPYVLNHGRWPHGSDWLCEAAVDTYLPLVEALDALAGEGVAAPLTVGVTPILANQLAHPSFRTELAAFLTQRLGACDEAEESFSASGEDHLIPLVGYWRERHRRLRRLIARLDGDVVGALARHADQGRIELLSSAATHGFLPLLAREESIALQLAVGRAEHQRLFGRLPDGCWAPECAYRPRGDWQPDPAAPFVPDRPGIEEHLGAQGYKFFFVDAHLAEAGRGLGLYRETGFADGVPMIDEDPIGGPGRRSPYRTYQVSPRAGAEPVVAFVRDPAASRQVWSRHGGFPGDGAYLEFHKIRYPGGLKFWRVTSEAADLGAKLPYEPNTARARAWAHAGHLEWLPRGETRVA